MLDFLILICVNALLYLAAASKRLRRSMIKTHWMMKDRWPRLTDAEKEEYEGLGMAFFLLPAMTLSGLLLAMLASTIIETTGG